MDLGYLKPDSQGQHTINEELAGKLFSKDETIRNAEIDRIMQQVDMVLMNPKEELVGDVKTHTTTLKSPWSEKLSKAMHTAEEVEKASPQTYYR